MDRTGYKGTCNPARTAPPGLRQSLTALLQQVPAVRRSSVGLRAELALKAGSRALARANSQGARRILMSATTAPWGRTKTGLKSSSAISGTSSTMALTRWSSSAKAATSSGGLLR